MITAQNQGTLQQPETQEIMEGQTVMAKQTGQSSEKITEPQPQTPQVQQPPAQVSAQQQTQAPPAPSPQVSASPAVETNLNAQTQNDLELSRVMAIRKVFEGRHPDLEAQAVLENWDVRKASLEFLRAQRPVVPPVMRVETSGPAIHSVQHALPNAQVLEAACMMVADGENLEKHFEPQVLDAANKQVRHGFGLQELILEAAWGNGYTGRKCRDLREVMRYAFVPEMTAGFSNINIGGILSNISNKFLLEGFFTVEQAWRNISSRRSVNDFKTVTSYRLIGIEEYQEIPPHGEFKHGTLDEQHFTNQAKTYGLTLSIDRRDIINDDLGAITTVPRKLGRGSGLAINRVFWTEFLSNSNFFCNNNNNYESGVDTVLGIESVSFAEQMFMDLLDPNENPIGVMPQILLVPTSLSVFASQLYKSAELRSVSFNETHEYLTSNPHQGKFKVEVSRYLSNKKFPGHSDTAWYMLASPQDLSTIEIAFLYGNESPTIENTEADFNTLGIRLRGFHDFGVSKQDPLGGVKMTGK